MDLPYSSSIAYLGAVHKLKKGKKSASANRASLGIGTLLKLLQTLYNLLLLLLQVTGALNHS
jgi:hypothetical protein